MTRLTLDSNILIYALDAGTPEKHAIASALVQRAARADAVLTVQALAEVLAVMARKFPAHLAAGRAQAERWATLFTLLPTRWEDLARAAAFAERHRLQLWDSLIWQVARGANAAVFLSEDLQDGLSIEGLTVVNPFDPANEALLAGLLADARA